MFTVCNVQFWPEASVVDRHCLDAKSGSAVSGSACLNADSDPAKWFVSDSIRIRSPTLPMARICGSGTAERNNKGRCFASQLPFASMTHLWKNMTGVRPWICSMYPWKPESVFIKPLCTKRLILKLILIWGYSLLKVSFSPMRIGGFYPSHLELGGGGTR